MNKVAIVMGSKSDLQTVQPAIRRLKALGIQVVARVLSAHRTPLEAFEFAQGAEAAGIGVIIAAAGKAAHLPGVLAAHTLVPVIGLPVAASQLDGMDALFSIVQMPAGIPVATVGIQAAENAALLAAQILSVRDAELRERLRAFRAEQTEIVLQADASIQKEVDEL